METTTRCRVCKSYRTEVVVDLGSQSLSGIFPAPGTREEQVWPLCVVLCGECGLAQLRGNAPLEQMYGENYGYRSGLNPSMVLHLERIVRYLEANVPLVSGDNVVDIGSNDGTLLSLYKHSGARRIGIDPTITKFSRHYPSDVLQVPTFFSRSTYEDLVIGPARIVTTIAMFYDLPDPVSFARDVEAILAPDGLWLLEVSYTPWVIRNTAYDTICHEHLEYYSFDTLRRVLQQANLKVVDVSRNATNGGSIQVVAAKSSSSHIEAGSAAELLLNQEKRDGVGDPDQWLEFASRIRDRQSELHRLLIELKDEQRSVMALGASTKGNVLIQSSNIDVSLISAVGDVNPDKWGRVLPGSRIPIVSEEEVLDRNPDYLVILPWHFRPTFIGNLSSYLDRGGRLIFPLPEVEIVGG